MGIFLFSILSTFLLSSFSSVSILTIITNITSKRRFEYIFFCNFQSILFRYAIYTKFKIYSEAENYKLEIGGYEGNAGDSLNDPWYGSNISPFSTYDR